ncbi:MAG: hypothetical protein ABEL51_01080 [Salinibacter sp.]
MIQEILSALISMVISLQAAGMDGDSVDQSCINLTHLDKDDERVKIQNNCGEMRSVSNWVLTSTSGGQTFVFPAMCIINPEDTIVIESGRLSKPENDHCWLGPEEDGPRKIRLIWSGGLAAWNNDEVDRACLYTDRGKLVGGSFNYQDNCADRLD